MLLRLQIAFINKFLSRSYQTFPNIIVLNTGFLNKAKSLLIVTSNERYLINCADGTQKILCENSLKVTDIKNIFFTRFTPEAMGGLIGLVLGLNHHNSKNLCLHNFDISANHIVAMKKLGERTTMPIRYNNSSFFEDLYFKINSFMYNNDKGEDSCVGYLFEKKSELSNDGYLKNNVPSWDEFQKASELYKGESLAMLGERIKESKHQLKLANKFMVLDCPSLLHLDSLVSALRGKKLNNARGFLRAVYHLTDRAIFDHPSYQKFIAHLNSQVPETRLLTHIVVESQVHMPLSHSAYYLQTCLNHFFDEQIFPRLKLYDDYFASNTLREGEEPPVSSDESVIFADPFMGFELQQPYYAEMYRSKPWSDLKYMNEKDIIHEIIYKNAYAPPEFMLEKMQRLKDELSAKKESLGDNNSSEYPNVLFLGTSSSIPSKYRNISAILIEPFADTFVLFDCGEGTLDRIMMLYGVERGMAVVRNIRVICISHHHLDHHSGLYTLLRYRQLIGHCQPCLIIAIRKVQDFTADFDLTFNVEHTKYECDWCPIDLLNIPGNHMSTNYPWTQIIEFEKELNIRIEPVKVYHTSTSYGFVLSGPRADSYGRWKITYSGDRCPRIDNLCMVGHGSDLLIHEATFDDGLEEMAAEKRHSTVSQAIGEGVKMAAKFLMLTHFSSRHPLVPPVESRHQNVAQAYDFMRVTLSSCHWLKVLDSYLEYLFPRHWNDLVKVRIRVEADRCSTRPLQAAEE